MGSLLFFQIGAYGHCSSKDFTSCCYFDLLGSSDYQFLILLWITSFYSLWNEYLPSKFIYSKVIYTKLSAFKIISRGVLKFGIWGRVVSYLMLKIPSFWTILLPIIVSVFPNFASWSQSLRCSKYLIVNDPRQYKEEGGRGEVSKGCCARLFICVSFRERKCVAIMIGIQNELIRSQLLNWGETFANCNRFQEM